MAKDQTRRLQPAQIVANNDSFAALKKIASYSPMMPMYSVASGTTLQTTQITNSDAEAQAIAAHNTARDMAVKAEWDFHNYIISVKDQVAAQFGKDSNEYQSLGMKKKSEYNRPKPKAKPAAPKA